MKSIDQQVHKQELFDRLCKVTPQSRRLWGSMTPHQMICHLNDSFKAAMGERAVRARNNLFTRTALKWVAFQIPVKWPRGVKTMPELDQQLGGTSPTDFEKDALELRALINRFGQRERD